MSELVEPLFGNNLPDADEYHGHLVYDPKTKQFWSACSGCGEPQEGCRETDCEVICEYCFFGPEV